MFKEYIDSSNHEIMKEVLANMANHVKVEVANNLKGNVYDEIKK